MMRASSPARIGSGSDETNRSMPKSKPMNGISQIRRRLTLIVAQAIRKAMSAPMSAPAWARA